MATKVEKHKAKKSIAKVIADQSVSLDGFSAGPNVGAGNPLGDGGDRLHEWYESGGDQVRDELFSMSGALVVGRRMFDVGVELWGNDPVFHMPVFVVTHRASDPLVKKGGTTYFFITNGIEGALAQANAAAGDKHVAVLGGASVIQQCINAGLVDELRIHLSHVLLRDGIRFFDHIGAECIDLKALRVIESPGATHLTFRLANESG